MLSEIITKYEEIRLDNIVLCGCIIPSTFAWPKAFHAATIINEVGVADVWPVIAKLCKKQYGSSGTYGFKGPLITDRFHRVTHSGFFKKDFMQTFWKSFVLYGQIVNSDWGKKENDSHNLFLNLLSNLNIYGKVCFLVIPILLIWNYL
jgi:hypothetical protein